jgi:hypothetical protein
MTIEGCFLSQVVSITTINFLLSGSISALATGHPASSGPGAGFSDDTYAGGGSYGGVYIRNDILREGRKI